MLPWMIYLFRMPHHIWFSTCACQVVVLGGGSFGTAMAAHIANRKSKLEVNMLVRDPQICLSINEKHHNL